MKSVWYGNPPKSSCKKAYSIFELGLQFLEFFEDFVKALNNFLHFYWRFLTFCQSKTPYKWNLLQIFIRFILNKSDCIGFNKLSINCVR